MYVLSTDRAELHFFPSPEEVPGGYAALSHVWTRPQEGPPEQSFHDVKKIQESCAKELGPDGRRKNPRDEVCEKIRRCCELAESHGYKWVWIDTCCIDKTSSMELSEAINSMFRYYSLARICYGYLRDVAFFASQPYNCDRCLETLRNWAVWQGERSACDGHSEANPFVRSIWFERGWTLQELIAPRWFLFLSSSWQILGSKSDFARLLEEITGIPTTVLRLEVSYTVFSIAQRMSWFRQRRTTRTEDQAYCLLGLFGIHMPPLYGEGPNAFRRLQEELLRQSTDTTLFAWDDPELEVDCRSCLLAPSPSAFNRRNIIYKPPICSAEEAHMTSRDSRLTSQDGSLDITFTVTADGILANLPIVVCGGETFGDLGYWYTSGKDKNRQLLLRLEPDPTFQARSSGSRPAFQVVSTLRTRFEEVDPPIQPGQYIIDGVPVSASWQTILIKHRSSELSDTHTSSSSIPPMPMQLAVDAPYRFHEASIHTFLSQCRAKRVDIHNAHFPSLDTADSPLPTIYIFVDVESYSPVLGDYRSSNIIIHVGQCRQEGQCAEGQPTKSTPAPGKLWATVTNSTRWLGLLPEEEVVARLSITEHDCLKDHVLQWPALKKVFGLSPGLASQPFSEAVSLSFTRCPINPEGTLLLNASYHADWPTASASLPECIELRPTLRWYGQDDFPVNFAQTKVQVTAETSNSSGRADAVYAMPEHDEPNPSLWLIRRSEVVNSVRTQVASAQISELSGPISTTHGADAEENSAVPMRMALSQSSFDGDSEDHSSAKRLGDAFGSVGEATRGFQEYEESTSLRPEVPSKLDNHMDTIEMIATTPQKYPSSMQTSYDSDVLKAIRDGVEALTDSLPGLVIALDEVAMLHPFVRVAVDAFRVAVELELKRRMNDKKIGVVFTEMKVMMETLLQLRSIKDKETIGPDGLTIRARMQEHIEQAADEIKSCANACDAYSKKKLIVKVIKGSVWDGILKGFIDAFAKRRKAFAFALSIQIGVGVDDAIRRELLDAKIDLIFEFFAKAVSPEQQELAELVERKGGATVVMSDNEKLEELLKFKPATASTTYKRDGPERKAHDTGGDDLSIVKEELSDNPELAIGKNLEIFERKFKMQQLQLTEEVNRSIRHEQDRIVQAIVSGPHERIIDRDIHAVWRDMGWRGVVKTRHFVLALRDYYREQQEVMNVRWIIDQDRWALECFSLTRLQAISEAIDDDASGFVTIAEVNQFTTARPEDWSLPHWIAYWAIGWHITSQAYKTKIEDIFNKMFSIRTHIHPANRDVIDQYLRTVWQSVHTLTSSLVSTTYPDSDSLQARFRSYVNFEEQRLRDGLEMVRFDIDAMDTLSLIMGPGRVEKYLFPLLYLLLHRDFEIFRVCQTKVIHKDELWVSCRTILYVLEAVTNRYNDLLAIFEHQKLDPDAQFKVHASELLNYWHDGEEFWSLKHLKTFEFEELDYDDSEEDQNVDLSQLLHYPVIDDDLDRSRVMQPVHFNVICDACDSNIDCTRVICMECGKQSTFDFCDKPACLNADVKGREDAEPPHLPSHDMLKLRISIIDPREIGKILRNATKGLQRAQKVLREAAEGSTSATRGTETEEIQTPVTASKPTSAHRDPSNSSSSYKAQSHLTGVLTCVSCVEFIHRPCWYCIDCPEEANIFVCWTCDVQKGGVTVGTHQETHTLVRCLEPPANDGKDNTERRMAVLETQMTTLLTQTTTLLSQTTTLATRMTTLDTQMTSQLDRIQRLLQSLVEGRAAETLASSVVQ